MPTVKNDPPSRRNRPGAGRPHCYRWDDWFARGRVTLTRGTHYHCSQSAFAQQVRNAASVRGLRVSVAELDGAFRVVVVATRKGD